MTTAPKKHILIITNLFPTPSTASYSGTFIVQQLKALQPYYEIVVLVPYRLTLKNLIMDKIKKNEQPISGVTIQFLPYFPLLIVCTALCQNLIQAPIKTWRDLRTNYLNLGRLWIKQNLRPRLTREAQRLHSQYNFSLVHGHELFIGDEAAYIGKQIATPSIITIHALLPFHTQLFGSNVMPSIFTNLNGADCVLAVSELARRSYASHVNKPISIMTNGFTYQVGKPLPKEVIEFIGKRKVILSAGFFLPSKKIDLLIKAVAQLKNNDQIAVIIIGLGPLEQELKAMVKRLQLEHMILFVGEVDPANMASYYKQADIVVQPSISESFSMICLEAMAYGKPFICTNNTGIAEFVHHGHEALIIPPNKVTPLVDALAALLADDSLRHAMGRNGKETAKQFEWKTKINETRALYDKIIQQHEANI